MKKPRIFQHTAQSVHQNTRLNWISNLERRRDAMDWVHPAQDRGKWRALVNTVMNLRVSKKTGDISLLAEELGSSSRNTLLDLVRHQYHLTIYSILLQLLLLQAMFTNTEHVVHTEERWAKKQNLNSGLFQFAIQKSVFDSYSNKHKDCTHRVPLLYLWIVKLHRRLDSRIGRKVRTK